MSKRLDEIEARLRAATPGPWAVGYGNGKFDVVWDGTKGEWIVVGFNRRSEHFRNAANNVDLIAHAPADLAALLRVARAAAEWETVMVATAVDADDADVLVMRRRTARAELRAALTALEDK